MEHGGPGECYYCRDKLPKLAFIDGSNRKFCSWECKDIHRDLMRDTR